jgi:hypothetical protein
MIGESPSDSIGPSDRCMETDDEEATTEGSKSYDNMDYDKDYRSDDDSDDFTNEIDFYKYTLGNVNAVRSPSSRARRRRPNSRAHAASYTSHPVFFRRASRP